MTRNVSNRTVSLAALAAAMGLIVLAAPSSSCPTRGGSSSSGGNMSQGSDSSRDNGAGERQRESVDAAAGEGLGDSAVVGSRGSGADATPDPNVQIGAVSQARAVGDAAQCRALQAQLAALTGDRAQDHYANYRRTQSYVARITQMTPAMLDAEIASRKAKEDAANRQEQLRSEGIAVARPYSATLSQLMDLRATQALGFGGDGLRAKLAQSVADAKQEGDQFAAADQAQIRDLNAQISDLGCANFTAVTSASNQ